MKTVRISEACKKKDGMQHINKCNNTKINENKINNKDKWHMEKRTENGGIGGD